MTNSSLIFDEKKTALILERSKKLLEKDPFLQIQIESNIISRLTSFTKFHPLKIAIVGLYTKNFLERLKEIYPFAYIKDLGFNSENTFLLKKKDTFDLILNINFLHHINDVPGNLSLTYNSLKPCGLFLCAFFGEETLFELETLLMRTEDYLYKKVYPRTMPKIDIKTLGFLLQRATFYNPVADKETYTVEYDSLLKIAHDLRTIGLSSSLLKTSSHPFTKKLFEVLESNMKDFFLTYSILYATGIKS